ncbi:hypothetical protein V6N13_108757 [Hibiscus sabdariffa]|uniref:Uncharacterized protein n=1 Tax=Hibiscus sabdariffa TaxID=183260 RepID=A0ABR1ZVZ1_9ROSI
MDGKALVIHCACYEGFLKAAIRCPSTSREEKICGYESVVFSWPRTIYWLEASNEPGGDIESTGGIEES